MKELLKALKDEKVTAGLVLGAVENAALIAEAVVDGRLVSHYLLPNNRVLEIARKEEG